MVKDLMIRTQSYHGRRVKEADPTRTNPEGVVGYELYRINYASSGKGPNSPLEFEDLCNGERKIILKRVYKEVFVTPAMCMTSNGMMCHLFTFEVMIVKDDAVVGEEEERYYNCACPKNVVEER